MSKVKEVKSYEVCGFKFNTKEEAEKFDKEHTFVFDDYEGGYIALAHKDIDKYQKQLVADEKSLYELYVNLANSNSMGSLYPLSVISYVFDQNNINTQDVWNTIYP